jgi:hypothetical protein
MTASSRIAWLVSLLLAILASSRAWAGPYAVVDALWTPDAAGRWHPVRETGEVVRIGDRQEPLAVGDALAQGDRVVVAEARARLRLAGGEAIVLDAGADVVLEERGVLQQLGDALYHVRDAFRVRYGYVEAAVDGTRFAVLTPEPAADPVVAVVDGRVTVSGGGEPVPLRGRGATAGPGPRAWSDSERARVRELLRLQGPPRLAIGAFAGFGAAGDGFAGQLRLDGRLRVGRSVGLVGSAAVVGTGDRFHLAPALGAEQWIGPGALGVAALLRVGPASEACGPARIRILPGAALTGRWRVPLGGPWGWDVGLEAGWAGGPYGDLGTGVSLAW